MENLLQSLFVLVTTLLSGRILLALLPPGRPGDHEPRELPVTLAASYLLGRIAFLVYGLVLGRGEEDWADPRKAWVLALAIAVVGLFAWLAGPRAMVPRHEPPARVTTDEDRLFFGLTAGLLALWVYGLLVRPRWMGFGLPLLEVLALLLLHREGLRTMRAHALGPLVAAGLYLLATVDVHDSGLLDLVGTIPALHAGGTAAFALASWRRADRRATWIAALGFFSLPFLQFAPEGRLLAEQLLWALGGPAILLLFHGAPMRRRYAVPFLVGALFAIVGWTRIEPLPPYWKGEEQILRELVSPRFLPLLIGVPIALLRGLPRLEREFHGLCALLALTLLCTFVGGSTAEWIGVAPLVVAVGLFAPRREAR